MRRVVVTGLGAVTPLGLGVRHIWKRLINGESGIVSLNPDGIPQSPWNSLPSTVAGLVPSGSAYEHAWTASEWLDCSAERRMATFAKFAVAAAEMAFEDAGWWPRDQQQKENTGICLGSGIGNLEELYNTSILYGQAVRFSDSGTHAQAEVK